MLTLYRKAGCSRCDEVEGRLRELTLAHRVVRLEEAAAGEQEFPADAQPPILRDDEETYVGVPAIDAHLEQVARVKDRWQQHGADACYCDE